MGSVPVKRRKLSHDREGEILSELSSIQSQTRAKRPQQEGIAAVYSGCDYKSSLHKLQLDELLTDLQPNYDKRLAGVNDLLHQLKGMIERIEDRGPLSVSEAAKSLQRRHNIIIPYPEPQPDNGAAYKLAYAKPCNINVVGSFTLKTMVKYESTLAVDLVVVMPDSIFQEKDFLNYRYFYKRAYYIACIAAGLENSALAQYSLQFEHSHGNSLRPILVLKPKPTNPSSSNPDFQIQITPAAPPAFFAESKLRPEKNSIRSKEDPEVGAVALVPTPFYNASMQSDCNFGTYLKLFHASAKFANGFRDACILGRIWLRQRGFDSHISRGGFGHFEWAALTAILLKGGGSRGHPVLSPGYTSYQMFKATLQFLSTTDLTKKPLLYEALDVSFPKSNLPFVYDGPRGQSLLYKMTPWSYCVLCEEAKISIMMLSDDNFDHFEPTFIRKTEQPLLRFDCTFSISLEAKAFETLTLSSDHVSDVRAFSSHVFETLQEGLMDRVQLIHIKEPTLSAWPTNSDVPSMSMESILVSVVFDPDKINRLVDHGPFAEDKQQVAKFRRFWGEKSELRRFKDGSIRESLVWLPGSTYFIFENIITFLVARHYGQESCKGLKFFGDEFEKLIPGLMTASKDFGDLRKAFKLFEDELRQLEGLPLQLRHLSAICPQLRSASLHAPNFSPGQPLEKPAEVLIQFEGSGRWPDNIVAIQRTKIAILLKIGSVLNVADVSMSARVGLENENHPLQNCAFLDIIYQSGAAFRLRIHNEREQTLLERQIKDKLIDQRSRDDAVIALSAYKRTFKHLALLSQSINAHCTRFPLLSGTIRLVKLWFERHMLSRHFSDELIELIVVQVFLQPFPWRAPSSVRTGFLRTLLFMSRWDWRLTPIIVDFTGTMTIDEIESIKTRLDAWRKIDPGMNRTVLFVASSHDATGIAFSDQGPCKMIAARMTALARSACQLVKEQGFELESRSLFKTSFTDFDFLIRLSNKISSRHDKKNLLSHTKFKNLEIQSRANIQRVGYEPAQLYLNDLENLYLNHIVFFYDAGGSVIAGVWNPQSMSPRPFKVNLTYPSAVVKNVGQSTRDVVIDKSSILAQIARLGGDMVSCIESKG